MSPDSAIGSVFAAFGLSGAAGANAWLPLLAAAVLDRLGATHLAQPFGELSTDPGLAILAILTTADFVGDKIPALDHALHAIGLVIAPLSGAALAAGQTGAHTDIPTAVAAAAGGSVAGAVHAVRAAVRPASTALTAGVGNPFLSLGEDVFSAILTAAAFLLPVLAFLFVAAALVGGVALLYRHRRQSRRT